MAIIEFTEKFADDVSWGRGTDHGTLTFRCNTDIGPLPLFHLTSSGQLNLQINFMRSKDCLLYTSPSPRDPKTSRMPSSA